MSYKSGLELVEGFRGIIGGGCRPFPVSEGPDSAGVGYAFIAKGSEVLFGPVIAGREFAAGILGRGAEELGGDHAVEVVRESGRIAALVIVNGRLVLEATLQQLEGLGITAASAILADAECILDFVVRFDGGRIVASGQLHRQLLRN